MRGLRWLTVLIIAAILIIAGFQGYWLRENYLREKLALNTQTDILFKDLVRHMADSALQSKIRLMLVDSGKNSLTTPVKRLKARNSQAAMPGRFINVIGKTLRGDSLSARERRSPGVYVTMEARRDGAFDSSNTSVVIDSLRPDRIKEVMVFKGPGRTPRIDTGTMRTFSINAAPDAIRLRRPPSKGQRDSVRRRSFQNNVLYMDNESGDRIMIRMDSLLNDTLPVKALHREYSVELQRNKIEVPFSIGVNDVDTTNEFGPGNPYVAMPDMRYNLELGNSTQYLLKRISIPILFSLFLVGLTVFSFILLYRSLARQQRLARLKNDFISNITHELKTPIATVSVAIEALKNFNAMQNPAKAGEYLEISGQELQRLSLLVDKVLKLSMFEAKQMEINMQPADLEEMVSTVLASLRLQIEKSNAHITLRSEGDCTLECDKLHLVSVIFNLVDNALKYSSEKPEISISLKGEAGEVRMEVADNGIGIPAQYRSKIFEKFFRVPAGNTHNAKGHGLGLSYVSTVMKEHNGSITVQSEPGKGSSFIIILPKNHRARI